MSTSYPYLTFARKHNLDYGTVLLFSDAMLIPKEDRLCWHLQAIETLANTASAEVLGRLVIMVGQMKRSEEGDGSHHQQAN